MVFLQIIISFLHGFLFPPLILVYGEWGGGATMTPPSDLGYWLHIKMPSNADNM